MTTATQFKIAKSNLSGGRGTKPQIAAAYVEGNEEERSELLATYGSSLVRKSLRLEAKRHPAKSTQYKAFVAIRDGIDVDRTFRKEQVDIVFTAWDEDLEDGWIEDEDAA